jgi:eukaryotic-like serine/threonine-protein kinase
MGNSPAPDDGTPPAPDTVSTAGLPRRGCAPTTAAESPADPADAVTVSVAGPPPAGPPRVPVLRAGTAPDFGNELAVLLRRRLLTLSLIAVGSFSLIVAEFVLGWLTGTNVINTWDRFLCNCGFLAAAVVYTLGLWRYRTYTLARLRLLELLGLAITVAYVTWLSATTYVRAWGLLGLIPESSPPLLSTVRYHPTILSNNVWFVVIIGYAMLIPNTGRRCLYVVSGLALTPLAITLAAASLGPPAVTGAELLSMLFMQGRAMAVAVAFAVFGAHKIDRLRREAFEARQLGQYQLKETLGAGGMGTVYLAEHRLLKRPCAIKLIRPDMVGSPLHLARFEREVMAMARLTHWNTVEIYDYGHTADGTFYYVMEYLPGPNLEQLVRQHGPLAPGRAVGLLRQVCAALREAHAQGLIHRDIKPSNILVTQRAGVGEVVKLLDFGLVQDLGEAGDKLTAAGLIVGTPLYMSPEQAGGAAALDGRADLYSLGAVAYFLVTGRPPFADRPVLQVLNAHLSEPPVPPSQLRAGLPADLEAVILRCLSKEPARRFADVDQLDQALACCGCAGGRDSSPATSG